MSFNPDWEIVYLFSRNDYRYCVIKKPEPIPGEKILMVREGCQVMSDGRWVYWRLKKPMKYDKWKSNGGWEDSLSADPNAVVAARLNNGNPGVIPAPVFKANHENNWGNFDPDSVPDFVTDEMLGDLKLAHLQLCDELQEGKPLPKK